MERQGAAGGGRLFPRLEVVAAAVLFSTGGAAIKGCTLGGWALASLRSGVAVVAILLLVPEARRRWTRRTWLVGLAYAGMLILYVLANKLTTAANTIFLQDTAPLYVLLLGPLLLGERFHRADLGIMALIGTGMALFFVGSPQRFATAPDPTLGNALAVAAGVFWALTILGLRWLARDGDAAASAAAAACGNLIAFAGALAFALPLDPVSPKDAAIVLYLGAVQIGLAYVFLTRGMRRVPALETSLLLLIEPVLNPVWAWLAHGERPGPWAIAGGILILSGTVLRTLLARMPDQESSEAA